MIVFSVLNRLVTEKPSGRKSTVAADQTRAGQRAAGFTKSEFERYRAAVRQDLEWLLNTRRLVDPLPDGLREVEKSVYCYGLPDFSQLNLANEHNAPDFDRLAAMISRAIELFEPRILDVRVTVGGRAATGRDLHFHVFGRLRMKPRPEAVCYDTTFDVTRGEYEVGVLGEGRA
jgi:type VI secretion system protein ImpF